MLEIGCGAGQLTASLAERGCRIVAVELGTEPAAVTRRNPRSSVIPRARRAGFRLLVTPDTILRWHRDLLRRRCVARSRAGTLRPPGNPTRDPQARTAPGRGEPRTENPR
ncbi:MAG: methyltransferase domain-containing protein [Actinomadura sp.]